MRSYLGVAITTVVMASLMGQAACGYIRVDLDVKRLATSSDVVCRVGVIPGESRDITYVDDRASQPEMAGRITRVVVLSAIKGDVSGEIEIAQPVSTPYIQYTGIAPGYTYIVFLRGTSSPYKFTDVHNGAIRVPSETPKYNLGCAPTDKLLAELLNAAKSDDERMRSEAIAQLGKLGDVRARDLLGEYSQSGNLTLRTAALLSRSEMGDVPAPTELLAVLRMDASKFSSTPTRSGLAPEQLGLVRVIEFSVQRFPGESQPNKKLQGFDYLSFIAQAMESRVIAENAELRSELVLTLRSLADPKSIPLLLKLLNDPDQYVRYDAATALAAAARSPAVSVSIEVFRANEDEYIRFWKNWARDHPEGR